MSAKTSEHPRQTSSTRGAKSPGKAVAANPRSIPNRVAGSCVQKLMGFMCAPLFSSRNLVARMMVSRGQALNRCTVSLDWAGSCATKHRAGQGAPFERDDEEAWLRRAAQGTEPSGAMDLGTSWLTHAPVHPLQQTLKDLEGAMPTSEVAQGRRRNAMPEAAVARNTSARKFPGRHLPRCQNSRRRLSIRGGRRGRKPIGPDSGARPDGFVIATGLRTRYRMAKKCPGFKGEHPGLQGIPGQATRVTRSGRRSGQGLCVLLT